MLVVHKLSWKLLQDHDKVAFILASLQHGMILKMWKRLKVMEGQKEKERSSRVWMMHSPKPQIQGLLNTSITKESWVNHKLPILDPDFFYSHSLLSGQIMNSKYKFWDVLFKMS
jgi:hypothetical protein